MNVTRQHAVRSCIFLRSFVMLLFDSSMSKANYERICVPCETQVVELPMPAPFLSTIVFC